ncbi:MAG: hypothetical protein R8G01_05045 [Ilumatobacteraceae bacterium]|nr:hypothetical protein [Ilumatobacteraceae bacterium]
MVVEYCVDLAFDRWRSSVGEESVEDCEGVVGSFCDERELSEGDECDRPVEWVVSFLPGAKCFGGVAPSVLDVAGFDFRLGQVGETDRMREAEPSALVE